MDTLRTDRLRLLLVDDDIRLREGLTAASQAHGPLEDEPASLRPDVALDCLNRRELAVLQELGLSGSDTEIARRLYLSEQTVSRCIARIVEKLGLVDRCAAIRLARRTGLRAV